MTSHVSPTICVNISAQNSILAIFGYAMLSTDELPSNMIFVILMTDLYCMQKLKDVLPLLASASQKHYIMYAHFLHTM